MARFGDTSERSIHRNWIPAAWSTVFFAVLLVEVAIHANLGLTVLTMVLAFGTLPGSVMSFRRTIVVDGRGLIFRRYFFGEKQLRVDPEDITSLKFYYVRQVVWGRPVYLLFAFQLDTNSGSSARMIRLFGWNSRRTVMRQLSGMVEQAGLALDKRTEGMLLFGTR